MSMTRAARRGLLRSALVCILPAALVVGVLAQLLTVQHQFSTAYASKALLVFVVGAALVFLGLPRHHPFSTFGAANRTTLVRGALVALLAALVGERSDNGAPLLTVVLAVMVAVLDGVDGWLARRSGMTSRFGARFDMETDALLIMVLAVLAWQFGKAGAWVLGSGLLRYAFLGAGRVLPWLRQPLPPSHRRKVIAVVQIIALIVVVAPWVSTLAAASVALGALVALTGSFAVDVCALAQSAVPTRVPLSSR